MPGLQFFYIEFSARYVGIDFGFQGESNAVQYTQTQAHTQLLLLLLLLLLTINKTLFFRAHHPEFGVELFESDGTAEGTKVYNIHPTNHSTPRYFSNFKGELYFVAYDGTHGYEIFKLEGTWGEPELSAELPKVSVYPNPFDQNTMINWYLPDASKVEIRVFSMMGKEIAMLENGYRSRGNHQIAFNGSELPTGVYFCQIKVNDSIGTSKMMIMR